MLTFHRFSGLVAAGALVAVGAFLGALATSERTLHNAFATALEQRSPAGSAQALGDGFDPAFLRPASLPATTLHAARGAVHVGDLISWTLSTGGVESYQVVDIQPLRGAEPGSLGNTGALVLVTATAVGDSAAATLRFVVELKPELSPSAPVTPRAL